jgi:ferredoxin
MGHAAGKDIYRKLGKKVDNLTVRAPWNDALYNLLKKLYTAEEAEVVVGMPYTLSSLQRIAEATRRGEDHLRNILDGLCQKGLVIDFVLRDRSYYMPSPFVVGIFEFTMMRLGDDGNYKEHAELLHAYMVDDPAFWKVNFENMTKVTPIRTMPHEEALGTEGSVEILDYEKASAIVESEKSFSIGNCSCRHMKHHVGDKRCDTPIGTCSSFGYAADYLVRNNLARRASRSEMKENLARSREMGLVFNADNVKKNVTFICHCCGCCCEALQGISRQGYPHAVVTSSFISTHDPETCERCGKCVKACPIRAIKMIPAEKPLGKRKRIPRIDASICLGCGVCALKCEAGAIRLQKRDQRVLHPESTFERVILQCLENGTLQNQIFDDPNSKSQEWMRAFLGGVLRLSPVKKALLSDTLRSSFLSSMKKGVASQGKAWIMRM